MPNPVLLSSSPSRLVRAALIAALGLAPAALGRGPDVIVGEIPEVSNYTSGGAVNGRRAYAIGTTSCNIGDTMLTWIANTNQHPVISQNMYRLSGGRFEQIGQAWLKHGFCALQGDVCGSCSPNPTGCPALGVGCSDPYSSGLNGSQSGLGPKAEVNASTGFFPYPWNNNGTGSGALFKRLTALDTDLTTAGALYFVSSMYVQPEDAAAGNDNNNESYRRVTFDAGNRDMNLQGITEREKPAIQAWRDHGLGVGAPDPGVVLTNVDVAGDGRFIVGAKATNLGGGQWHYEYAIQNLTSHRSGQSFSVPLPAGAVVTNVGFKDVEYHSGELTSNTDWTSNVSAAAVTWATQTFAQSQNANSLRWDTIYNFRFDCNIPPAGGPASIGLFRTGSPSSASAATIVPSPDGTAHPINDLCANAAAVGAGVVTGSTAGATTDGPAEPAACTFSADPQIASDVWFIYTSGSCTTGPTTFTTCGSTFDTEIAIYPGGPCPAAGGTVLFCNDDSAACGADSLQSSVSFTAAANTAYRIRLGGYQGATGDYTLTITAPNCTPPAPANDLCAGAVFLADNAAATGTSVNALNDGSASCGTSGSSPDVWYAYRPQTAANLTIDTCTAASYDTVVTVFNGCGGAQVACNDDACGLQSRVSFPGVAGQLYLIRVAGFQGATGTFTVKAVGGGGVIPPAAPTNDNCSGRIGIALGTQPFSTANATTDGIDHAALCTFFGNPGISNDIWYNHPSLATGTLNISTCGSGFDTELAVYSGADCGNYDSRLLACNDDAAGCAGNGSSLSISVVAGQNYLIRVGGFNGATGAGALTLAIACRADFNGAGGITVQDIFDFLSAYFSNDPRADFNGAGGITVQDIFDFLSAYFTGCA